MGSRNAYVDKWIALKGKEGKDYKRHKLSRSLIEKMMEEALLYSNLNKRLSPGYEDDIDDEIKSGKFLELDEDLSTGDWFVRTDLCSLKRVCDDDGKLKKYKTVLQLFEDIVKPEHGHNPIYPVDRVPIAINLYLFPWLDLDQDKEFRVFVHNGQVTAISQQNLYRSNTALRDLDEPQRQEKIHQWCQMMLKYIHGTVNQTLSLQSYVADLAIVADGGNERVYFIELNPFGSEYTSGSALFHWLNDYNALYGYEGDTISFRYVE